MYMQEICLVYNTHYSNSMHTYNSYRKQKAINTVTVAAGHRIIFIILFSCMLCKIKDSCGDGEHTWPKQTVSTIL